jgi:predicted nucleic acid-binding protein
MLSYENSALDAGRFASSSWANTSIRQPICQRPVAGAGLPKMSVKGGWVSLDRVLEMAVVADTAFLIDAARGDPGAVVRLRALADQGETLVAPVIVAAEFLDHTTNPREALGRLQEAVRLSPFLLEDAIAAAEIARELRSRGAYPGRVDCLIAGFARARGDLPVLTRNGKHFPASKTLDY